MKHKWIGWIFIVAGLSAVSWPFWQKLTYERQQQELLVAFEQLGVMEVSESADGQGEFQASGNQSSKYAPQMHGVRGMLKIGKINMQMLVFEGVSENELGKGAGMIEPQKYFTKNNIGIAGHRAVADGKQFNRLGELAEEDEIQIAAEEGTFHYRVTDTFVVHQSEVSVLEDKESPLLTLITCTPIGKRNPTDRLIVQAELQKVEPH